MKKGFVLVESMVVITFLATSLLLIYSSFNTILVNEKRRMYYDDPVYLYRTYYILDFFQKNNVFNYVEEALDENTQESDILLVEVSCNNAEIFIPGSSVKAFCETLISTKYLEVEHIYFTHYDLGPLTACADGSDDTTCVRHQSLQGLTPNAVNYMRTLGGSGQDGYRMIIEYVKEELVEKETESGDGTEIVTSLEKKYFYASLSVPLGGSSDEE